MAFCAVLMDSLTAASETFQLQQSIRQKIDILYQALESGIIDADRVIDTLMSTKREQISLQAHKNSGTPYFMGFRHTS